MKYYNFWSTTAPKTNSAWVNSCLPVHEVDVLIVGAGGAGLTTAIALALANQKRKIAIVDAGVAASRGASKGIGVATSYLPNYLLYYNQEAARYIRLASIGIRNLAQIIDQFGASIKDKDWCRPNNFGGFHLLPEKDSILYNQEYLNRVIGAFKEANIYASLMSSDSVSKLANVDAKNGALFVPNDLFVNTLQHYNGLYNILQKLKIPVISGFTVSDIDEHKKEIVALDYNSNYIRCKKLVLCTGSNLMALPKNVVKMFSKKHLLNCATTKVKSTRLSPYVISTINGEFVSRRFDNRIIASMLMPKLETGGDYHAPIKTNIDLVSKQINDIYSIPTETEKAIEFAWIKTIVHKNGDGLPVASAVPGMDNVYLNTAYNTYSLGMQQIGSMVINTLIDEHASKETEELASLFNINRTLEQV